MRKIKAVLFNSVERHQAFKDQLDRNDIDCTVLDFKKQEWIDYDYSTTDIVIYYSYFNYSSNHPHALYEVYDNLMFIHERYPNVVMFPDPNIIKYYNDKYRQFLFLKSRNYPIPRTIPLVSPEAVEIADRELGYPMIIKNRYGAGGGAVFRVYNKKELMKYYNISTLNLFNIDSVKYFSTMLSERIFYYWLIKAKKMIFPFLSPPLLAQKYVTIDRDLKTVVGDYKVVEAHWRFQANKEQWKVNIDGGGVGVWGKVHQEAIDLSEKLARDLNTRWLNIDMLMNDDGFLITEFSPVWHHYAYKEKPSFVYKDDYNIDMPLEESLNLEKIIVDSLVKAVLPRESQG
jgi:glutathione synthase/RimK-type ligase-like ATP-grasp enzyme